MIEYIFGFIVYGFAIFGLVCSFYLGRYHLQRWKNKK